MPRDRGNLFASLVEVRIDMWIMFVVESILFDDKFVPLLTDKAIGPAQVLPAVCAAVPGPGAALFFLT